MKVTLLDTKTGKTVEDKGMSAFQWTDGNWSCDCNRALMFNLDIGQGICAGSKRFIVIKAEPEVNVEGDYEATLAEMNHRHPQELLRKHGIEI